MNLCRLVCILLPLAAASCQPPANRSEPAPPSTGTDAKRGTITVTIDGCEATPLEAEAVGVFAKNLLSDAISETINEGLQDLWKKLDISDQIETDLFSAPFDIGISHSDRDELCSVYLIRPAKEAKEPRTTVYSCDGKHIIRFTRAIAPVERPLAIVTLTFTKDGRLEQTETFLVYSDGEWKQYHPTERNESVK